MKILWLNTVTVKSSKWKGLRLHPWLMLFGRSLVTLVTANSGMAYYRHTKEPGSCTDQEMIPVVCKFQIVLSVWQAHLICFTVLPTWWHYLSMATILPPLHHHHYHHHRLLLLVGIKICPWTGMIIKMILHTVLEKVFGVENPRKVESREIPTKEGGLIPGSSNSIGGSLL